MEDFFVNAFGPLGNGKTWAAEQSLISPMQHQQNSASQSSTNTASSSDPVSNPIQINPTPPNIPESSGTTNFQPTTEDDVSFIQSPARVQYIRSSNSAHLLEIQGIL